MPTSYRLDRFPESGTPVEGSPISASIRRFLFKRFTHAIYERSGAAHVAAR